LVPWWLIAQFQIARAVRQIALAVSQQDQGVVLIFEAMNELSTMMEDTEQQPDTTKSAAVALEGVSRRLPTSSPATTRSPLRQMGA
jgi:hypothetical protein